MKYLTTYLGLSILLTFLGCTQNPENVGIEIASEEATASTTKQQSFETVERKLTKEGQVEFETENLNSTRKTIFDAVNAYDGYVSSDQEFKSIGRKSNTVIIRIPADKFDILLRDATRGVEKFESKEINVKDVTEEFLDIKTRLKTKKELEQRFIDLLKEAKNVTEILEIEIQIGHLRSDIESIEGRFKYLEDRVSFSTLTMIFYERIPNETEFGEKFKTGFKNGWNNIIWFFVALTNIWPFIIIGLGIAIGIRVYKRMK